jgi:hypothetical protein
MCVCNYMLFVLQLLISYLPSFNISSYLFPHYHHNSTQSPTHIYLFTCTYNPTNTHATQMLVCMYVSTLLARLSPEISSYPTTASRNNKSNNDCPAQQQSRAVSIVFPMYRMPKAKQKPAKPPPTPEEQAAWPPTARLLFYSDYSPDRAPTVHCMYGQHSKSVFAFRTIFAPALMNPPSIPSVNALRTILSVPMQSQTLTHDAHTRGRGQN